MTRSRCGSPSGSVAGSAGGVLLCMQLVCSAPVCEFYFIVCEGAMSCVCVWDEARHGTGFVNSGPGRLHNQQSARTDFAR